MNTTSNKRYARNEIWLVDLILFLSKKKFHAKQVCVLSSFMKLGPDVLTHGVHDWSKDNLNWRGAAEPGGSFLFKGSVELVFEKRLL